MSKKFQKKIEDFTCQHCGLAVTGTGYTNHCPRCLYSKHVDVNPGDRQASCQGMMKPVYAELKNGEWIIIHQCEKCGIKKRNKASAEDNIDALAKLSAQIA